LINTKRMDSSGIISRPVEQRLQKAVDAVPAGRWAVGVSGGADSTALLRLLVTRDDLQLTVAHLNHQTRGEASDGDEKFVRVLAASLQIPFVAEKLSALGDELQNAPANPSAKYRQARFLFFSRVIEQHGCRGVLLAHHAGDVDETVFQRLMRGSGYTGLTGIAAELTVQNVLVLRPLLRIEPILLRDYLRSISQTWRTDASNDSNEYGRNRVRSLLACHPSLRSALDEVRRSCLELHQWVQGVSPCFPQRFAAKQLASLPSLFSREAAKRWLIDIGCPADLMEPPVIERLIQMASDACTPSRQVFPGKIVVVRKSGWIDS